MDQGGNTNITGVTTVGSNFHVTSGSVGIGTNNPSYLIDAHTSSGNAQLRVKSGGDLSQLILESTDTSGYSQINFADAGSNNIGMLQYFHSDNHMEFTVNGAERLRITSDGKIGIGGLTNPGALLSIPAGESNTPRLAIESAVDDNDFTITQYEDGNGTYTMLGQNVKLNSGGNNTILDSAHRTAGILLDARNHGSIVFLTGGANAVGEKLKIDDDGRVLVGPGAIATPKCGHAGIDIPNNDWAIIMGGSDGNGNRANNANKDGRFAGAHYVNAEEPVGIIRCTSGASANELHMGGGTSLVNAATQISLYTAANTTTTGGTERLRITADGKTGIGGITPQNLLNVNATGSMGLYGTTTGKTGHSIRFIRKYGSGATHNFAVVDGASPRGQSRLGGFVATYTYRSAYGFDSDGGGHGIRMLSGRVRDSGEWGFDGETNVAAGDGPIPTLQGVDNNNGTCTLQVVNPSSTHSYGEFHIVAWDCQITTPTT